MMMKDSRFYADFKCFRKGVLGWGGGPLMTMKNSLFLLIPNVSRRGCGARRGPYNDDARFFVSADFKFLERGLWGWGGGPLMTMKDSLFLLILNVLGRMCGAGEGAQ